MEYGTKINSFTTIKETTKTYFEDLYFEQEGVNTNVTTVMLKYFPIVIAHEENVELMKPIEESNILNAIWGLTFDKALGPNGFSIHFYRAC